MRRRAKQQKKAKVQMDVVCNSNAAKAPSKNGAISSPDSFSVGSATQRHSKNLVGLSYLDRFNSLDQSPHGEEQEDRLPILGRL